MTEEEITEFDNEQKEFTQKKKRIDIGKKIQKKIKITKTAIEQANKEGTTPYELKYWIDSIINCETKLDKDPILMRNIKMFLSVLKDDYEKMFKSL